MFLHQNLWEALKSLVGFALVPKKEILQASSLKLKFKLYWDQLQVWLTSTNILRWYLVWRERLVWVEHLLVKLHLVVWLFKQWEFWDMNCVHSWLVWHEIFKIILNRLGDLDLMAFYLALQPEAETWVMYS